MCRRRGFVDRSGTFYTCKENGGLSRLVPMPCLDKIDTLDEDIISGYFGVSYVYTSFIGTPKLSTGKYLCYFSQYYRTLFIYILKNKNKGFVIDLRDVKKVNFSATRRYKKENKSLIGFTSNRVQLKFDFGVIEMDFLNHITSSRWMLALTAAHGGFRIPDATNPSIWYDGNKYYNSDLPVFLPKNEINSDETCVESEDKPSTTMSSITNDVLTKSKETESMVTDDVTTEESTEEKGDEKEDVKSIDMDDVVTPPMSTKSSRSEYSNTNEQSRNTSDSIVYYKYRKPLENGSNESKPPTDKNITEFKQSPLVTTSEVDCTLSDLTGIDNNSSCLETGISDVTCKTAVYGRWKVQKAIHFPRRITQPDPFNRRILTSDKSQNSDVHEVDENDEKENKYERKPVSELKQLLDSQSFSKPPFKSAIPTPLARTSLPTFKTNQSDDTKLILNNTLPVHLNDKNDELKITKNNHENAEKLKEKLSPWKFSSNSSLAKLSASNNSINRQSDGFILGNALLNAANNFSKRANIETTDPTTTNTRTFNKSESNHSIDDNFREKLNKSLNTSTNSFKPQSHKENNISGLLHYWTQVEQDKAKNGNADFYPDTQA